MLPFFNVLWKQILWNVGIYSYTFDFDTFNNYLMTLSKVSFSDILRNDYLDHFDTFENDTFEGVWVDAHSLGMFWKGHFIKYKLLFADF